MPPAPPRLSRRQLLASGGLIAIGTVFGVAADRTVRGAGGSAAPGDAVARSGAGSSPLIDGPTPTPAASPTPSPTRRSFRTRPDLVPPLVELLALRGIPAPGLIFLTPANGGGGGPTIVDSTGELVWALPRSTAAVTDLRVMSFRGAPVLGWWEGDNNAGVGAGEHVLMDATYREVARIRAQAGRKADLHELRLTRRGTALFFADASIAQPAPSAQPAPTSAPPGQPSGPTATASGQLQPSGGIRPPIMDCSVQEVDLESGQLVFEWHSVDHVGTDESVVPPPTGDGVWDYFHGNSIEEDLDGTLLISARNTSAVYKVDRSTGRVLWRLGGRRSDFAIGEGAAFALQHDVRRQPDGAISVFDDGQGPAASRGIMLRVDEQGMTATLEREYPQPDRLFSGSQGNLQLLPNGHVFVGWGSTPRFSEFDRDGQLILDALFTASQSYRDSRFPWAGRPDGPPDIAVDRNGDGVVVYASWNGATDIASWELLAGASSDALRTLTAAPRTGFETLIRPTGVRASDRVVVARARDAIGRTLGTSAPVPVPA